MKAANMDPEHPGFKYFLQAFKYGMPSHGGFGLGFERLTQKFIGLNNVKEATLFPRDINRLAP
jgi:aspartyl/asparaginyl-tRNA synthetase